MPIERARTSTGNGHRVIRCPGVYAALLQKRCEQDAFSGGEYLVASDDPVRLAAFEQQRAERTAALMAERDGKPVTACSSDLPPGLPVPFDRPRGRQRSFVVSSDDTVTLRTLGAFEETTQPRRFSE
jgi:hypothetical protein